ncbi:MAG: hypothetical protein HZB85_09120 [Deltaproteobacteria bacterium]|nr:hypothetical protein [Deltaproteobacteria bacterium]
MIKEMRKVQIIGPKGTLDECIKTLHATSVVHIETAAPDSFLHRLPIEKERLLEKESLERSRETLRNLLFLLKTPPAVRTAHVEGAQLAGRIESVGPVVERVKVIRAELDALTEELSAVNRYEKLIIGFAPVVSSLGGLKNFEIAGLTLEKGRTGVLELLAGEIDRITEGRFELHTTDIDEATLGVVVAYARTYDAQIRYLLTGKSINEIRLPDDYADLSFLSALKLMRVRKDELPRLMREYDKELERVSNEWYGVVKGMLVAIDDAIDEIGVLNYAVQTGFTFVIEGWIPADLLVALHERFAGQYSGAVLVRELPITPKEAHRVPVCIVNPKPLRPFEVFLGALPLPRYGSVDPTPYVAVFFPIFFGLMVGDVGYGVVILAIGLLLRRRFRLKEKLRDIATVLAISSVSAIIFGVLFGEFFGDLGMRLGLMHPLVIHRAEALKTMMGITLVIGAGHVMLGVIIGAANQFKRRHIGHACAKLAYLAAIVSFLVVICAVLGAAPKGVVVPGVVSLVISVAVLSALEGALGPIEMIKAVGNILSYVRIMAVGTASVVMANVANRIGGLSENIFVGILIGGAIHALNILLSLVSPVIQSMRLQYVEFFSKFFEAGGIRYAPFRKR